MAISFRIPRYHNENVQQPVPVFVELRKPSEKKRGEPRPFQYLPMERGRELYLCVDFNSSGVMFV